jgi:hypothetical protein
MKPLKMALFLLIVFNFASLDGVRWAALPAAAAVPVQESALQDDAVMPQYKLRKESTPRARVGGSLRGGDGTTPVVVALVPDHVGLTVKTQPSLCWYVSKKTSLPATFVLVDPRAIRPVLEVTLPVVNNPGVQCVLLKDYGVSLEEAQQYRWAITLILDPEGPSGDMVSGGMIERIPFEESCLLGLPCTWTCGKEAVNRYAEAGLWYDAMSCLHELIEADPNDLTLRKKRATLLKQIDLPEVVQYDLRASGGR